MSTTKAELLGLCAAVAAGTWLVSKLVSCHKGAKREVVGPEGPLYCKSQKLGHLVFASGQIGLLPGTRTLAPGGINEQTKQALENLKQVLEESGSSLTKCLKVTAFLNDIADYAAFNEVYLEYFNDPATRPARVCFGPGGLPLGALVEVDATAYTD